MGCCTGMKKEVVIKSDLFVDLEQDEIREEKPKKSESVKSKGENSNKSDALKNLKTSSKFLELSREIYVSSPKKDEKDLSPKDKRIKNTAKKLKLITDGEVKNLHKFFI